MIVIQHIIIILLRPDFILKYLPVAPHPEPDSSVHDGHYLTLNQILPIQNQIRELDRLSNMVGQHVVDNNVVDHKIEQPDRKQDGNSRSEREAKHQGQRR